MTGTMLRTAFVFVISVCLAGSATAQFKQPKNTIPPSKPAPAAPAASLAPAQTATASATPAASATVPVSKQLAIAASTTWTDSGIDLAAGDKVTITSDGNLKLLQGITVTPEGLARSWRDVMRALPLNSAGTGALIARIGDSQAAVPFLIGAKKEFTVTRPGRLFLGINLGSGDQLDGSYNATVQRVAAAAASKAAADLKFDDKLFDQIPRRITDQAGGKGDMVNFLMIGPIESVKDAFNSGGWVSVDRTKSEAALHAVLATMQKQSYLEMPMSELYLFGRPQDFGFARAEPISVVQTRHHLRIWKAPFQVDGQDVWIGAATHDIGFEKDQRNNGVTHKIDPEVDKERDFVHDSLTEGGGVLNSSYVLPKDPVQDAKTATGGSFRSDGRVLILQLRPAPPSNTAVGH